MLGKTNNQLLQQTEQAIQQKVPQNMQAAFQRAVTAGLTIMYSQQSNKLMMDQLLKGNDPVKNVGDGAAKLIGILYRHSNHTMPVSIIAPASIVFMCEGLDFLEKAGKVQVTKDVIDEATQDTAAGVLQLMGVSQDKLHQTIQSAQSNSGQQQAPPQDQQAQTGIIGSAMGAQ